MIKLKLILNSYHRNYYSFESNLIKDSYYISNGQELCYVNSKEVFCKEFPYEYINYFFKEKFY